MRKLFCGTTKKTFAACRGSGLVGTVRFLLALCVVATYSPGQAIAGVTLLSGITAVQAFYVISGFLITMVLNERKQYQSVGNFYLSRYLRLWPSYFVIAVASFLIYGKGLVAGLANMQWSTIMFIWISNCTIFFQDLFFFLKFRDGFLVPATYWSAGQPPFVHDFLIVPQCWTLGVELTFYLIAPFVCRSPWRVAGLFLFGLGARLAIGALVVPKYDLWQYRFSPAEMTLFALGGLAYFGGKWVYSRLPGSIPSNCLQNCLGPRNHQYPRRRRQHEPMELLFRAVLTLFVFTQPCASRGSRLRLSFSFSRL